MRRTLGFSLEAFSRRVLLAVTWGKIRKPETLSLPYPFLEQIFKQEGLTGDVSVDTAPLSEEVLKDNALERRSIWPNNLEFIRNRYWFVTDEGAVIRAWEGWTHSEPGKGFRFVETPEIGYQLLGLYHRPKYIVRLSSVDSTPAKKGEPEEHSRRLTVFPVGDGEVVKQYEKNELRRMEFWSSSGVKCLASAPGATDSTSC
jgi:hypothetical protein